jgi:hypothetical protein
MRLEQMRAIAKPLGLELPPLAGGSFPWIIPIPEALGSVLAAKTAINTPASTALVNIVEGGSTNTGPTMMEAWDLFAINVPFAVLAGVEGEAKPVQVKVTVTLLIGGDIAWEKTVEVANPRRKGSELTANGTVADNFASPITYIRGRQLQLRGTVQLASDESKEYGSLRLFLGQQSIPIGGVATGASQSTLLYHSVTLSGRREI